MAFLWFGRKKKGDSEVKAKKEEEIKKEMDEAAKKEHDDLTDRYKKARDYDQRVASGENPNTVFDDVYKNDESSEVKEDSADVEEKKYDVVEPVVDEETTKEADPVVEAVKEKAVVEEDTHVVEPVEKGPTKEEAKPVVEPAAPKKTVSKPSPKKVDSKEDETKKETPVKSDPKVNAFDTSKFKGMVEDGKYVIAYDQGKLTYQFVLKDKDDKTIFTSKIYKAKSSCKNAIKKFVETVKAGYFQVAKCEKTKFKFKLYSKTDRLTQEGKPFPTKEECEKNIESVLKCVDSKVSE